MRKFLISVLIVVLISSCSFAENIKLPEPQKSGGMSLMDALTARHSAREFNDVDLTLQELSDLLYAAAGVNRENGLRVYPVAMGLQDTFVYVFNREGVYKFDALTHSLELVAEGDHRQETGKQDFVGKAAVNLAYVQDTNIWNNIEMKAPKELIAQWGFSHTGAVMQNVYLFAASRNWNSVVRGSFDSESLAKLLKLEEGQQINLIHSIGPKP